MELAWVQPKYRGGGVGKFCRKFGASLECAYDGCTDFVWINMSRLLTNMSDIIY